jgi:hypothetical protein
VVDRIEYRYQRAVDLDRMGNKDVVAHQLGDSFGNGRLAIARVSKKEH